MHGDKVYHPHGPAAVAWLEATFERLVANEAAGPAVELGIPVMFGRRLDCRVRGYTPGAGRR